MSEILTQANLQHSAQVAAHALIPFPPQPSPRPVSKTEFKCPICQGVLLSQAGTQMFANEGITVWCPWRTCPAGEVSGHGRNEKQAFEIIIEKFDRKRSKPNLPADPRS
jgi:hypothetical protein